MFDVGLSELLVIGLVALIVIGPKRLPEVARAAGRWMVRLRRFVSDVKMDFDRELHNADLSELRKFKDEMNETRRVMEDASGRMMQDLQTEPSGASSGAIAPPAKTLKRSRVKRKKKSPPKTAGRSRHGRKQRT